MGRQEEQVKTASCGGCENCNASKVAMVTGQPDATCAMILDFGYCAHPIGSAMCPVSCNTTKASCGKPAITELEDDYVIVDPLEPRPDGYPRSQQVGEKIYCLKGAVTTTELEDTVTELSTTRRRRSSTTTTSTTRRRRRRRSSTTELLRMATLPRRRSSTAPTGTTSTTRRRRANRNGADRNNTPITRRRRSVT